MMYKKEDLCSVTVLVKENYPESFLAIFNTVREHKELLEVKNDFNNNVTVICYPEIQAKITLWLEQFGDIVSTEKVLGVIFNEVDIAYDYDEYEDLLYYVEQ